MTPADAARGDAARERILDATFAAVARGGLGELTVEAVASEAGVSRATIYRRFPGGREQLITDTVEREVERFLARVVRSVPDAPATVTERVVALVMSAHRELGAHEVMQRLLREEAGALVPELVSFAPRLHDHLRALLAAWFRAAHDAGEPVVVTDDRVIERAADHAARMVLSYAGTRGRTDLTRERDAEDLVRRRILGGVLP